MEITVQLGELRNAAKVFWEHAVGATVFALHGEMGAGKTTFIHALCEEKGVTDVVSSPTFSLINEYLFSEKGVQKKIYHIDLYRLRDEEEARSAGIEDCLYSDHLCMVEWPEKSPGLFPENTLHIYMERVDEETRLIRIREN